MNQNRDLEPDLNPTIEAAPIHLPVQNKHRDLEPDLNPTTEAAPIYLSVPSLGGPSLGLRSLGLSTSMPKSLPPSPPNPSRRNSSTMAKGVSPFRMDPKLKGQSLASVASLVRGRQLQASSRAPSLESGSTGDRFESCYVNVNDDGGDNNSDETVPPQRRQSIHNVLPSSSIIPRFKIEYEPRIFQYVYCLIVYWLRVETFWISTPKSGSRESLDLRFQLRSRSKVRRLRSPGSSSLAYESLRQITVLSSAFLNQSINPPYFDTEVGATLPLLGVDCVSL